jgi:hypothetical protein
MKRRKKRNKEERRHHHHHSSLLHVYNFIELPHFTFNSHLVVFKLKLRF